MYRYVSNAPMLGLDPTGLFGQYPGAPADFDYAASAQNFAQWSTDSGGYTPSPSTTPIGSGFWYAFDRWGKCVDGWDPFNIVLGSVGGWFGKAGFTVTGGVVPKSVADLLGVRIVIMDKFMSIPSAYQVIVKGTAQRTAPRMIARVLNPAWIAYGAYMAVVEVVCLGTGIVQSIRQG